MIRIISIFFIFFSLLSLLSFTRNYPYPLPFLHSSSRYGRDVTVRSGPSSVARVPCPSPIISRSLRSLLMMKDMIMWRGSRGSSFTLEPRARSLHSRSLHEWDESGVVGSLRFPRSTTPLAFGSLKIKEKNARPFAPLRCLYGKGLEPVLYPSDQAVTSGRILLTMVKQPKDPTAGNWNDNNFKNPLLYPTKHFC